MTSKSRVKLISTLRDTDARWEALLPASAGTFYGRRIAVSVDTEAPVWADRSLTRAETALLTSIFNNLPNLLAQAKQAFDRYSKGMPRADEYIADARIQIHRSEQQSRGTDWWWLSIEFRDSDAAFYVQFDGLRLAEAWGGD